MIEYTLAKSKDLPKIIALQELNLKENLTKEEVNSQGYVTVVHTLSLLEEMNSPYPHIVAKDGDEVVGYTLVMQKGMKDRIPILVEMINEIDAAKYDGQYCAEFNYVIIGQVCVAKGYRGQGVLQGMYDYYKQMMRPTFDYIVTGISTSNVRSMKAHKKQGFDILNIFEDNKGEWANVIYNLKN